MRFRARKQLRFGPIVINLTQRGFSSWGIRIGRFSHNFRTKRSTVNTPGPGSLHFGGRKR